MQMRHMFKMERYNDYPDLELYLAKLIPVRHRSIRLGTTEM